MTTHQEQCSERTIELFLSDGLSEDDELAFEEHLSSCDDCCSALRDKTAEVDWWRDARSYLSTSDLIGDEFRSGNAGSDPQSTNCPLPDSQQQASAAIEQLTTSFLAPTDDPRMLGRFGGYEIAGIIGQGGMGIVLKGLDPALNRYSAIKVLAPHFATSGAARQRFAREARAAAAVVHDNVMAIHGVDEAGSLPYLVMPYVRGESLHRRIEREGALSVPEILRIARQAAAGLAAAHDQGLVHRDIKPANILLPDGVERVLITDFGLARTVDDASLTRSGVIAGTPQFMSPEQARGDAIDRRSDLFSLGSVIYAMCTGRAPFRAETSYGILRRITDVEPRSIREINPGIPEWLCQIVNRLHAKSPDDRFDSATDVERLLGDCLAYVQNPDLPLPEMLKPESGIQRKDRIRWIAVGLFTVSLLGIAVAFSGPWINTKPAEIERTMTRALPDAAPDASDEGRSDPAREPTGSSHPVSETAADVTDLSWNDEIDESLSRIRLGVDALSMDTQQFFGDPRSDEQMRSEPIP